MENIYNLFKFIEDKYPQYRVPFQFKIINNIELSKEDLDVKGNVDLAESNIKSLPDGLKVGGYLNLRGCTSLTSLPDSLVVGSNLNLRGCTSLTSLPRDLKVEGWLGLKRTPITIKYTEDEIREMCPGIKGDIYL
jgi:hypothetical protein